jgi:hypothetical protein
VFVTTVASRWKVAGGATLVVLVAVAMLAAATFATFPGANGRIAFTGAARGGGPSLRFCGKARAYYREHGTRQYVEVSKIRTHNLRCPRSRHVARKWARNTARMGGSPAHRAARFRCRFERIGSDIGQVFCQKGTKGVRFREYDSSPYH